MRISRARRKFLLMSQKGGVRAPVAGAAARQNLRTASNRVPSRQAPAQRRDLQLTTVQRPLTLSRTLRLPKSNLVPVNARALRLISGCAADYANSLGNPFSGPDKACIPDFPPLDTNKSRIWIKGTTSTSSNATAAGFGWLVMYPELFAVSDAMGVIANQPTSVATTIRIPGDANALQIGAPNAPYLTALVGSGKTQVQYRVVSAGLRMRNISAVLQRGGYVTGMMHPAHATLSVLGSADINSWKESSFFPGDTTEWLTCLYRPVADADTDFKITVPVNTNANPNAYYMGFAIQAADTSGNNPQTYEFEAFVNIEYMGAIVVSKTPSHVDEVGFGAVAATTIMAQPLLKPHNLNSDDVGLAMVHATNHYIHTSTSGAHLSTPPPKTGWFHEFLGILPEVAGAIKEIAGLAALAL